MTNDHSPEMVPADNWKNYVGQTGDEITGEGIFIRVPLECSTSASTDIAGIVALTTVVTTIEGLLWPFLCPIPPGALVV
ncbi:hypothetical protein ACVJBD_002067 [Rhizobium mongolense]